MPAPVEPTQKTPWLLLVYLAAVGLVSVLGLIANFPTEAPVEICQPGQADCRYTHTFDGKAPVLLSLLAVKIETGRGFMLLALLAGVAGAFLHAAQSATSYLGDRSFKSSWHAWYFLRPLIGGVLGVGVYVAVRGGFIETPYDMGPYGVISFAFLGGWFSKAASDKMGQIAETIFSTDADKKRGDKLKPKENGENGGDANGDEPNGNAPDDDDADGKPPNDKEPDGQSPPAGDPLK